MFPIGISGGGLDLLAQNNFLSAMNNLAETGMKLSTLKRINRGSDDPAGLIALEGLKSELTSLEAASRNSDRAISITNTADTGLSQVSDLLNRIQGNLVEAAGTSNPAELRAHQLEIDAALETIDRIGNTASFQHRNLLDGSSSYHASDPNPAQIRNIEVHSRSSSSPEEVTVDVTHAAEKAKITSTVGKPLAIDTTFVVQGNAGSATLNLSKGTTVAQIAQAVNDASDSTGVTASVNGTELTLTSTDVGSDSFLDVKTVSGNITPELHNGRATGSDVVVNVNGNTVSGQGNHVEIRSDDLSADIDVAGGFQGTADPVRVSGNALTFMISADIGELSKLSLPKVGSGSLGGAAGKLSELYSGGASSLAGGNLSRASEIVSAARDRINTSRARLGAFVKNTVEVNVRVLDDTQVNLSSAISRIGDLDVAKATADLSRHQILSAASANTLAIASGRRTRLLDLLK